jgi:hypothetical protein
MVGFVDEVVGQAGSLEPLGECTELTLIPAGESDSVGAFRKVPNTAAVTCRVYKLG